MARKHKTSKVIRYPGICPRCGNYGAFMRASADDKTEQFHCFKCDKTWDVKGVRKTNPMLPMPPTMHIGKKALIMPALPNPMLPMPPTMHIGKKALIMPALPNPLISQRRNPMLPMPPTMHVPALKRNVQAPSHRFDFEAPPNEFATYKITPKLIDKVNPPEYLICPKCGKPCSALYTLARNADEAWAFYDKKDAICGKDLADELAGDRYKIYPPMKREE